ncbi:MAG: A-macroglobulin complement component, partial [Actinomycetia bacterium]|nr:A-macroglobulin complement component [Actinomycetes bacterium]
FTTRAGNPIRFSVGGATDKACTVTLSQREQELAAKSIQLKAGKLRTVRLDPGDASGVLIATAWDADGNPLAERLVFHEPAEGVQVTITADADRYVPGGTAKLTVETTNSDGDPIAAVVGLSVTDDSVLEMIDRREQAPRLPVMVLLENDVKELADAHVYLDPKDPRGPLATDLLLGTQGWRRFALVHTDKLLEEHGDQARRALALRLITRKELRHAMEEPTAPTGDPFRMDAVGEPFDGELFGGPGGVPPGAPDGGEAPFDLPLGEEPVGPQPDGEPAA